MLAHHGWAMEADPGGCAAALMLERAVARGLPFAEADGERRFDPAEAINHIIAAGLAGTEPEWARFAATGRALACSLDPAAPAGGPPEPRRFRVSFARRFYLGGLAGRERVRLRLPRPIEDHALAGLRIAIAAPIGTVIQAPGRIEVRIDGPPPAELTIGWTADFLSRPGETDRTPAQSVWLDPDEGLARVTPRVRALADALAGDARNDAVAVTAFRDYLIDRFTCGIIAYEAIAGPATDHVLATGWYDCQLGSALLVALCRARGIPARLVGGYLLWPASPTRHMWCEIWLNGQGWRPFDPIAWDLSSGGGDAAWRGAFAGYVDHRIKTEVLPAIFTGPMSLPLPAAHHRLVARAGDGVTIDHLTLAGDPIYRDAVSVLPDPG